MKFNFRKTILAVLVLTSLSATPLRAQEANGGFWSALGQYVANIVGNLDYVNIASEDLGIDNGIIAKVILGTSRVVERNPETTGDHDRYLVKDKMRIGLRLGAGFVVAGSASYVRQYTIVYPVSKKLEGIFHDKFIVNLLLPFQVAFDNLPKKYVLMTESFIEGQARLKLGGTSLIPLGSTTSLGRVQLSRNFIDNKSDKKVMVFRDKAKYTQLAQDLSFSLGLIGIPIYEGRLDKGKIERKYLEIDISSPEKKYKCQKALKTLLVGDDVSELYPLGKLQAVKSKFVESYNYFTLAWLFTIEGVDRVDRITEEHENGERGEYVTRYQVENRRNVSWTLGIDGELHMSKLWAMARGVGDKGYEDPEIRIALVVKDSWLKSNELKGTYDPFINKITYQKNFMPITKEFTSGSNLSGEFNLNVDIHLYEEAFDILLNTSERKYWAALAKVAGKKISYFKEASTRNYHSRDQRRMRQNRISLKHLYLAKSMKAFVRRIAIAKKKTDPLEKMHWLILGLRKLTYVSSETFMPEIFQIIHGLVGTKNIYIRVEMANLIEDWRLSKGEKHRFLVKSLGKKRETKNKFHPFYFQDAGEIYYLF